jgi:type III secretion system FlhB-like substrate exporter
MARGKKHTAEQIVNLLRQVEVAVASGKTTALACKEATITEQTYYRWRKVISALANVMVQKGVPEYQRSDNGPEFVARDLRK